MYKTTIRVEGMACGMCESHINEAVRKILPGAKVKSSKSKCLTEIISENIPDTDKIVKAINETGYSASEAQTEPYKKKGLFSK